MNALFIECESRFQGIFVKITSSEIKLFEIKTVKAIYLKIMHKEENIKPNFMESRETNPFRVPEGYFDSLEDEVMSRIQLPVKKKTTTGRIIRILKPVVGIAACLTLVYLLTNHQLGLNTRNSKMASAITLTQEEDSTLTFSLIDEITLVNAMFAEEEQNPVAGINPDDMLAYLSSGLNEVEIYSAIQN